MLQYTGGKWDVWRNQAAQWHFEGSLHHELRCVPETSTLGTGLPISSQALLPATFYLCEVLTLVSVHLSDCCFSTEILFSSSHPVIIFAFVFLSCPWLLSWLKFPLPISLNPMAYLLSCIHSISWLSHDKTLTLKSRLLPKEKWQLTEWN